MNICESRISSYIFVHSRARGSISEEIEPKHIYIYLYHSLRNPNGFKMHNEKKKFDNSTH